MILVRFATLWWAVLVGFVALAILKSRHPGKLSEEVEGRDSIVERAPDPSVEEQSSVDGSGPS